MPASPAAAGEVHFDPDSPAGKEYALPLPQARNEALGGEGITGGSPTQAPLFGVGVSDRSDEGAGGGGDDKGRSGGRDETENGASAGKGDGGGGGGDASSAARQTGGDPSYDLGTGIGLVAAVLVAGLLLGILLRVFTHTGSRELNTQ